MFVSHYGPVHEQITDYLLAKKLARHVVPPGIALAVVGGLLFALPVAVFRDGVSALLSFVVVTGAFVGAQSRTVNMVLNGRRHRVMADPRVVYLESYIETYAAYTVYKNGYDNLRAREIVGQVDLGYEKSQTKCYEYKKISNEINKRGQQLKDSFDHVPLGELEHQDPRGVVSTADANANAFRTTLDKHCSLTNSNHYQPSKDSA